MWDALRWLISVPLAIFGIWALVANITAIVLLFMRRWRGSLIPLIGGVCLAAGMLICPVATLTRYAWLPLLIDPGCGLILTLLAFSLFRRAD